MNDVIKAIIAPLIGIPCTRKAVGRMKSLSLGFGDIQKDDDQHGIPYRFWELGTYYGAWRIIQKGKIVCGSQDPQSIEELNTSIDKIAFGNFAAMRCLSAFDFRIELDNELLVDFLTTISDNDESFHVFCPGNRYIEFTVAHGWKIGESKSPWS